MQFYIGFSAGCGLLLHFFTAIPYLCVRKIFATMKSKTPLFITFIFTAATGLLCYFIKDSDGDADHHRWVMFQLLHIITSIIFVVFTVRHILPLRKWYVKWGSGQIKRKSFVTLMASLSCFVLLVTGLDLLIFIDGGDSTSGVIHFYTGLVFIVFCAWHCIKRWWLKQRKRSAKVA